MVCGSFGVPLRNPAAYSFPTIPAVVSDLAADFVSHEFPNLNPGHKQGCHQTSHTENGAAGWVGR